MSLSTFRSSRRIIRVGSCTLADEDSTLFDLLTINITKFWLGGQFEDWCIADAQTSDEELQKALDWACGNGADCSKIQVNQPCYFPNTVKDHASCAFYSYYQKLKRNGAICYFNAAAILTALNPSVSPGNVPVYHGSNLKVKEIFSIQKKARFTDMKAFVFLVIANGLAAAYSLVQVLRCVLSMIRGSVLFNKPLAWVIFSGDQIMAYLTLAAVAAAAQSAICNMYEKFCNQIGEGIAGALVVSIAMVVLSAISAFSLFRLYGDIRQQRKE
ncbi:unnamed protein product [Fraxinus pennsylvanica]|uniref:CASP-like protein n=1 Tax=Fraxinus pennsylvanica TaxID=56036 RepID=A0AAD1YSC1_9LAMI|nr:unnamed protein product [Fraxinus pennsylvanica]